VPTVTTDEGEFGRTFWSTNKYHFAFVSESIFPTFPNNDSYAAANVGTDFVTMPGIWYVFYREFGYTSTPSYCKPLCSPQTHLNNVHRSKCNTHCKNRAQIQQRQRKALVRYYSLQLQSNQIILTVPRPKISSWLQSHNQTQHQNAHS
jgi:hypothetical protein